MNPVRFLSFVLLSLWPCTSLLAAPDAIALAGTWKATGERPEGGTREITLTFEKTDENAWKGVAVDAEGRSIPLDRIHTEGSKVRLEIDRDGDTALIRVTAEETEPGQLQGKWQALDADGQERFSAGWKAVRISAPDLSPGPEALLGSWQAKAVLGDDRELLSVVHFKKTEEGLAGRSVSDRGETAFQSVSFKEAMLRTEMRLERDGNVMDVRIEAKLEDATHLTGQWILFDDSGQSRAQGRWSAEKIPGLDLAGTWDVVAATDDGQHKHQAVFSATENGFQGKAEGDFGSVDYTSVEVNARQVKLTIPFGEGSVHVVAEAPGSDDRLEGKWTFVDSGGAEQASNEWVAERRSQPTPARDGGVTGRWDLAFHLGHTSGESTLILEEKEDGSLTGTLISPRHGERPLDSAAWKDEALTMQVTVPADNLSLTFLYQGRLQDDGSLSGTLAPKGYEEDLTGEWTARPQEKK